MFSIAARSMRSPIVNKSMFFTQTASFWSGWFGDDKERKTSTWSSATVPALIEAVKAKNLPAIESIARQDRTLIRQQTPDDNTALHEAAKAGDVETLEFLADKFSMDFNEGLNERCHCYIRRVAAHYASEGGHQAALEFLINKGADINIQDEQGRTCLDYALEKKNDVLALYIHKKGGKANKQVEQAKQYLCAHLYLFLLKN